MTKKAAQQNQHHADEATALVSLNTYLAKRRKVRLSIVRDGESATVSLDGDRTAHTEANLRHAVNAALAAELLR